MPYQVPCQCGTAVPVELYQAGTDVSCQACRRILTIPSSRVLQELAQEQYPHLSSVDKLKAAIAERTSPFNGSCQRCSNDSAHVSRNVTFRFLKRRYVQDDDGIQISSSGVELVVGTAEETWESISFPLLFCTACDEDFRRRWRRHWWKQSGVNLLLAIVAGPILIVGILLVIALPLISAGMVLVAVLESVF